MTPIVALIQRLSEIASYERLVSTAESEGFARLSLSPLPHRNELESSVSDSFRQKDTVLLLEKNTATEFGKKWSVTSVGVFDKTAAYPEVLREISEWLGTDPFYPAKSAQFFFVESDEGRQFMTLEETMPWHDDPAGTLVSLSISDSPTVSILHMATRPL